MPTNKSRRTAGTTVHKHQTRAPTKRQEAHDRQVKQTIALVNARVGQYMREHNKNTRWATLARCFYECLIHGNRLPGNIRVDQVTKDLVYAWVTEAAQQTGLEFPRRKK